MLQKQGTGSSPTRTWMCCVKIRSCVMDRSQRKQSSTIYDTHPYGLSVAILRGSVDKLNSLAVRCLLDDTDFLTEIAVDNRGTCARGDHSYPTEGSRNCEGSLRNSAFVHTKVSENPRHARRLVLRRVPVDSGLRLHLG